MVGKYWTTSYIQSRGVFSTLSNMIELFAKIAKV